MNKFLRSRSEIDHATKFLEDNGYVTSGLSCKNWDVYECLPYLKDGNILDMGSSGSIILENAVKKKLVGMKCGIDLAYPEDVVSPPGINLTKGDLMNTPFPDGLFNFITVLSVVEHQIDFEKLAKECSRLLAKGGELFLSGDFWNPKPDTTKMRLYSLEWNILDQADLLLLIQLLHHYGLDLTTPIDWTLQDAVINDAYCSPAPGVAYTFFVLHFIKK